jgi:hypothetical protein
MSAGITGWLADSWRAEAHSTLDRVADASGIPGSKDENFSAWIAIAYQATTFSMQGNAGR